MLLAKLAYSRRQFSPFGQRMRLCPSALTARCALYIENRRR